MCNLIYTHTHTHNVGRGHDDYDYNDYDAQEPTKVFSVETKRKTRGSWVAGTESVEEIVSVQ